MIYIYCALYCEARPIINRYDLGRITSEKKRIPFDCFVNEDEHIMLIVTGVGVVAASAAIASSYIKYSISANDFIINIGTCAAKKCNYDNGDDNHRIGQVFICNKLIDEATRRTFYPDMIYRTELQQATLVTLMRLYSANENRNGLTHDADIDCIYDMEGTGIYQASSYFTSPDRMVFIKVVSDTGDTGLTSKQTEMVIESRIDDICKVIHDCSRICDLEKDCYDRVYYDVELYGRLTDDLHCSKVMSDSLKQLLIYCELAGVDVHAVINDYYEEKLLPCKDKREGKKYLDEIKRKLI